jgi:c(7)-type cytochrome triheme protein
LTDSFKSEKKAWMSAEPKRADQTPSRRWPLAFALLSFLISSAVLAVPAEVRVPVVKEHGKADPPAAGVFSHWRHDQYQCYTCHPVLFPRARKGFTHDDMDEGKFCGACHDGKTAPPSSGGRAVCRSSCHEK